MTWGITEVVFAVTGRNNEMTTEITGIFHRTNTSLVINYSLCPVCVCAVSRRAVPCSAVCIAAGVTVRWPPCHCAT